MRKIVDALPAETRKPVYVTEFGVRGSRPVGGAGAGSWDDGSPLENTNVSAFQQAWFALQAARSGFVGAVKWDAYFGRYDSRDQAFGLIGPPGEGWPLGPVYNALRLLTRATRPGWTVGAVDGVSGSKVVTAFAGPAGELTVAGLDAAGSRLNTASGTSVSYAIAGLPPNARLNLALWNRRRQRHRRADRRRHDRRRRRRVVRSAAAGRLRAQHACPCSPAGPVRFPP